MRLTSIIDDEFRGRASIAIGIPQQTTQEYHQAKIPHPRTMITHTLHVRGGIYDRGVICVRARASICPRAHVYARAYIALLLCVHPSFDDHDDPILS